MKIFALETNEKKLIKSFLSPNEQVVLTVKFSVFQFAVRSVKASLLTVLLLAIGTAMIQFGIPPSWVVTGLFLLWFGGVFLRWLKALIDWRFDLLLVTTEEIVILDQTSIFRVNIRQMNLDNLASVSAQTQYWDIFPFGILKFDLKEGVGQSLTLRYIPYASAIASIISSTMVLFQRRRAAAMQAIARGVDVQLAEEVAAQAEPAPSPIIMTDKGEEPQA